MKSLLLSIAFALVGTMPASAQFGPWYAGYGFNDGRFEIKIDLEQLEGGATGEAVFFLLSEPDWCPPETRDDFCREMLRSLQTDPGGWGIGVTGVVYGANAATIAFVLPGEQLVRIAEITRDGLDYTLLIAHPRRGVDLELPLSRGPHSCAFAMCTEDRLDHLRVNPASWAGPLGDPAFVGNFPDTAFALTMADAQPRSQPLPRSAQSGPALWDVIGMTDNRQIGALYLEGEGVALHGDGALASVGFGPNTEVAIAPDRRRHNGFSLNLTFHAEGSGEQRHGLLLLGGNPADGILTGTLVEGTYAEIVRLVRDNDFRPNCNPVSADFDLDDLPAIGVYAPVYALRNVPEGQRLALRDSADRSGNTVGSLPRGATGILVLGCTPDIDSWTFEQADLVGKRRLLDAVWCEIAHENATGWLLGGYLDPAILPERY